MNEGVDSDTLREVNRLLTLASDLCMAYATAIRRVEDARLREELDRLDHSHDPYRAALGDWVRRHGGDEAGTGDWHGVVERMRVVLGDLSGDVGILKAMATNEAEMAQAYREARSKSGMASDVIEMIEDALKHEADLRGFYEQAIAALTPPQDSSP